MNAVWKNAFIGCVVCLAGTSSAWALSDDSCRDRNGLAINSRECIEYRKANQGLSDIDCFQSPECRMQKQVAARVRREREDQIKVAEQEEIERAEAAHEKQAAISKAAGKAKCGDDYKKPYIGMTLARVQECVTPLKLEGQFNGENGIVNTYRGDGSSIFQSIDGKIVHWRK